MHSYLERDKMSLKDKNSYIQIISYIELSTNSPSITCSTISSPKSLDEFDINMFDLRHNSIWNGNANDKEIHMMNDFRLLGTMIKQSKKNKKYFYTPTKFIF